MCIHPTQSQKWGIHEYRKGKMWYWRLNLKLLFETLTAIYLVFLYYKSTLVFIYISHAYKMEPTCKPALPFPRHHASRWRHPPLSLPFIWDYQCQHSFCSFLHSISCILLYPHYHQLVKDLSFGSLPESATWPSHLLFQNTITHYLGHELPFLRT